MVNEELFILEKEIKKKHEIALLTDLLLLYHNKKMDINIEHIYNAMHDTIVYSEEEKNNIINESLKVLKEDYNIEIEGK